jgi:hypothetical protein
LRLELGQALFELGSLRRHVRTFVRHHTQRQPFARTSFSPLTTSADALPWSSPVEMPDTRAR